MTKAWKVVLKILKSLWPGFKAKPRAQNSCVHCGYLYVKPETPEGPPEEQRVEVTEETDDAGRVETIRCYPDRWEVEILRQRPDGNYSKYYLHLCEVCFWMKPRFVGLELEVDGTVHYIWQDERGEYYERYEFGVNLNNEEY